LFFLPKPNSVTVDNALITNPVRGPQFISSSYFQSDSIEENEFKTTDKSLLKKNEDKALLLKAIEILKGKLAEKQLLLDLGVQEAPSFIPYEEYLVQGRRPNLGTVLTREQVLTKIGQMGKDFNDEAEFISSELETCFTGLEHVEQLKVLDKASDAILS
jgi:hypothetical protein